MATDATGAPTPLGIPKYNTSADAPSGLGFNAAMDAIDALVAARVSKPVSIASGEVPVWNGSTWVRSSVTNIGVSSLGSGSPSSSTFLRGDGTWAAASGTVLRKTTAVAVTNTVAETDLITGSDLQVAAGALGTNKTARLTVEGDWIMTAANASLPRFKLKLGAGSTVIFDTGATAAQGLSPSRFGWELVVNITNLGATGAQFSKFSLKITGSNNATSGSAFVTGDGAYNIFAQTTSNLVTAFGVATKTSAIDTTAAMNVILSVINGSATATTETKMYRALLEIV